MAKRFGRNQKRRMREQIAAAEASARSADIRANQAARQLANAESAAFQRFSKNADAFRYAAEDVFRYAAEHLAPELRPEVEKFARAAKRSMPGRPIARFLVDERPEFQETILTLHIPALTFSHVVMS